jgi:hypothetical protein
MKRKESKLGVILIALAFIFVSCEKEITTSNLTLDKSQTAKVKSYFFAELDKTKQGLELAPNGTKVFVFIPNSSLSSASGVTGNWIDSTTINDGIIEITVPTVSTGVTVTLKAAEFTYDQVQSYGSASNKISKIFSVTTAQTISVFPGESKTKEITYDGQNQLDNFVETVTCAFILKADMDETIAGNENVPQGTTVNLYTTTWAGTATVGADGKITATIPKSEVVSIRFEATKTLTVPPAKKFLYTGTIPAQSISTTYASTITLSGVQNEN